MSHDVRDERLILPASPPAAWNIGAALPHEEEDHALALARHDDRVTAHAFGPHTHEVRLLYGRRDPALVIYLGQDARAVLWPEQVAQVIAHWKRCGFELKEPDPKEPFVRFALPRWPVWELASRLAHRLAAGLERDPDDAAAELSKQELLAEARRMKLL